jgi:hypothetical protein
LSLPSRARISLISIKAGIVAFGFWRDAHRFFPTNAHFVYGRRGMSSCSSHTYRTTAATWSSGTCGTAACHRVARPWSREWRGSWIRRPPLG